MKIKGGDFILENIEKIVLPLAGVIFFWLLLSNVLMSPNYVKYDGSKYSPAEIDKRILKEAEVVQMNLKISPQEKEVYSGQVDKFITKLDSLVEVDSSLWSVVPTSIPKSWLGEQYSVPSGPEISDAQVEHIRAVAYIPTGEVNSGIPYIQAETEPNDLDLVTVEAKVDLQKLYEDFKENFTGLSVKPEWRDPCLIEPVFAAVQLKRAELLPDGSWNDWVEINRAKTDNMSELLTIIEDVHELPQGGLDVRLLQYKNPMVRANLLQPMAYDIGSTNEDWFPPSLHREFLKRFQEQEDAERREEMQKKLEDKKRDRDQARSRRVKRSRESTTPDGGGGFSNLPPGMSDLPPQTGGRDRTSRRDRLEEKQKKRDEGRDSDRSRKEEKTIDAVYEKFDEVLINADSELSKMTEPLLFWAHDDTAEAGKTYRYKIRLGVCNPIVGTKKVKSGYESYQNQVIIWGNEIETETVRIPMKLYFFAKDIQEAANTVKVEIFRYSLGYWYQNEYVIQAGEAIGKVDEWDREEILDSEDSEKDRDDILLPDKVDFSTGAVMVDTARVDDWQGSNILLPRPYFVFYYSYDGGSIEHAPIKQIFWASDMRDKYREINKASKEEREALRPRGKSIKSRVGGFQQTFTNLPPEFSNLPPGLF